MPGTLQVLNDQLSSFTLPEIRKNMAMHYKTRDESNSPGTWLFSPSSGEGQSHDKTELEKDMMRKTGSP